MTHAGISAPNVWSARGRGFSMGVASAPEHHIIHLTGQVAWDADERIVGPDDVGIQTAQCFRNIEALLAVVGGKLTDLTHVTTYYLDPDHLPLIQSVRAEWLKGETPPASTSVRVAGLGDPSFLVELSPIAAIPSERYKAVGRTKD